MSRVDPAERAEMWRRVHELGAAGAICDQIVRSRPVPPALLIALHEAPHIDERDIGNVVAAGVLTLKERSVLREIASGYENQDISDRLNLPLETVKSNIRQVLRKLDARNRTHAAAIAIRAGIIN